MAEAAAIPEADLVVVVVVTRWAAGAALEWAADAPPSVVAEALDQVATCAIIGTPTRATLTHGMETETGIETAARRTETETGMETETHGIETETGTDTTTRSTSTIMTVFSSGSTRIGIQDGGIMITDTRIIGVMGTAIPITTILTTAIRTTAIRTTVTTLAETGQRASKW